MSPAIPQKTLQELLAQPEQAGIHRLPHSAQTALDKAAAELGYASFKLDFCGFDKIKLVLGALGRGLGFPCWYGENLDALSDCLTDFSWREAPGYIITLAGADALHADHASFTALNEVLAGACAEWQSRGIPFWIFYEFANPAQTGGLAALPALE